MRTPASRDKKDTKTKTLTMAAGRSKILRICAIASQPRSIEVKTGTTDSRRLKRFECPVYGFQKIINGKYKIRIIWDLQHGPRRYGEIQHGLLTGAEET